jgi:hypothetical protein
VDSIWSDYWENEDIGGICVAGDWAIGCCSLKDLIGWGWPGCGLVIYFGFLSSVFTYILAF